MGCDHGLTGSGVFVNHTSYVPLVWVRSLLARTRFIVPVDILNAVGHRSQVLRNPREQSVF